MGVEEKPRFGAGRADRRCRVYVHDVAVPQLVTVMYRRTVDPELPVLGVRHTQRLDYMLDRRRAIDRPDQKVAVLAGG